MQKKFCVWDSDSDPDLALDCSFVFWNQSFLTEKKSYSIPDLVEYHSDQLKSQYLALIYDIGETDLNGKSVVEQLKIRDGLSFWWMTLLVQKSNWAKTPQITNILKLMAFVSWLKDTECTQLYIKSDNNNLIESFKIICNEAKLDIKLLPNASSSNLAKKYLKKFFPGLPYWLRGQLWLLREIIYCVPFVFSRAAKWAPGSQSSVFVSYLPNTEIDNVQPEKFNQSFWGPLPNHLVENGVSTNWLYLTSRRFSFLSIFKALKKINKNTNNLQNHIMLSSFFNFGVLGRVLRDCKTVLSKQSIIKHAIKPTCGVFWPLIKNDLFKSLAGPEMVSALLSLALFERVSLKKKKKCQLIYLAENQPWELGLINSFKSNGCQLIGFAHSTIRYWDLRYFNDPRCYRDDGPRALPLPDIFAVNGVNDRGLMEKFGYPAKVIEEVESLRYLYLNNLNSDVKSNKNENKTLLVLGDFLKIDTEFMLSMLRSPEVQENLSELEVVIKPHPACPLTLKNIEGIDASIEYSDLEELISLADIVYTGNVSSAAVEAVHLEKKVISARNPRKLNISPLRGVTNIMFVSDATSLNSNLLKCLEDNTPVKHVNLFRLNPNIENWRRILNF